MVGISGNNNVGFEQFSSKINIFKNFRMIGKRFNISEMFSTKKAFRVIIRISKKGLRTNAVVAAGDFEYEIKSRHEETICQQEK